MFFIHWLDDDYIQIKNYIWARIGKHLPHLLVSMLRKGVQKASHYPFRESRILRYYSKSWPQIIKSNLRKVSAIHYNLSSLWFHQPKQSTDKSSVSTSNSTNNTKLIPRRTCGVSGIFLIYFIWTFLALLAFINCQSTLNDNFSIKNFPLPHQSILVENLL